jgi:glutamine amidotransferase
VIVIIDYQAGNLTSVVRSLKALGVEGTVTQDPAVVAQATRVIFPGVGAAGKAMATLKQLGLDQALRQSFGRGIPILGICLGAQIILEHSEENDAACWACCLAPGRFPGPNLKIPMGWNRCAFSGPPGIQGTRRCRIHLSTATIPPQPKQPWWWG